MKFAMLVLIAAPIAMLPVAASGEVNTDRFSRNWQLCITDGERNNTVATPESLCNERELTEQDARLNQAYKMIMTRLPVQRKADLRTDERNWILARDRKCSGKSEEDQGECLIDETMQRIAYLERYR